VETASVLLPLCFFDTRRLISKTIIPCKIQGGVAKCLYEFYQFGLGPNIRYSTFDGALLGRLECNKNTDIKQKQFRLRRAAKILCEL